MRAELLESAAAAEEVEKDELEHGTGSSGSRTLVLTWQQVALVLIMLAALVAFAYSSCRCK